MISFKVLFIKELGIIFFSEILFLKTIRHLLNRIESTLLRTTLEEYVYEKENQIRRIERIFTYLNCIPQEEPLDAMKGLLESLKNIAKEIGKSSIQDSFIILSIQKVNHYEIASYGTLKSFAKELRLSDEMIECIQDNLDEESATNKALNKLALGSIFKNGINKEALQEV